MEKNIADALFRYFETLYNLNGNLIILCGVDVVDDFGRGEYQKYIEAIIHATPCLVPYKYNRKSVRYILDEKDGLLEFAKDMPFLQNHYENIMQKHYNFLANVKTIRNKFEHKMHGAKVVATSSGSTCLFDVTYKLGDKCITLSSREIIAFVEDMNELFFKIQRSLEKYVYEKGNDAHPYYRRLIRYDFCDFNKIYKSDLLRPFGKALLPF